MKLALVVAASENNVIGRDGGLPWTLPDDMKHFREVTQGKPVIMGRKTYESIPEKFRPLPDRINIVVTRQEGYRAPGCIVVQSFEDAVAEAVQVGFPEICVIGGAAMYEQALPYAHVIYMTRVHAEVDGDVVFPELDQTEWIVTTSHDHPADERHAFAFTFMTFEHQDVASA